MLLVYYSLSVVSFAIISPHFYGWFFTWLLVSFVVQSFFFSLLFHFIILFYFFKFYFIFKLYSIVLVLPYIEMNPPQAYMCSPSWTLLPPPSSLPIPSLWVIPVHQPQASSIVHRIWTDDSFHIRYYTYFNVILPNHPTLFLSHRVQKIF